MTNLVDETSDLLCWKVLCVDDEPSILRSLKRILPRSQYDVQIANSGAEGLEILSQQPIDLIISDMRMPEMTGAVFLEQVAKQYPDTVRILLTGYSDIESTIAAVNQGRIHRYVQKPWNTEDFLACLEQEMESKRLKIENKRLADRVFAQNEELKQLNNALEKKVEQRTQQIRKTLADLEKSHQQIKDQVRSIIRVFYNLMTLKGTPGSHYALEVSHLCLLIANKMNLSDLEKMNIKLAGLLSEVGVLCLDDRVMGKRLYHMSSTELEEFKTHANLAFQAMSPVQHLSSIAFSIAHQYERFDGRGNASSKHGEEIPIGARVLCLARDYVYAIHGVTSDIRLSRKGALAHLKEKAGIFYDPVVLEHLQKAVLDLDTEVEQDEKVISTPHLKPGMKLSRDVITATNLLLLPEGHVLTQQTINRVQSYVESANEILRIYVFNRKS